MKRDYLLSHFFILYLLFGMVITLISCGGGSAFVKKQDALNDSSLVNYISFDEGKGKTIVDNCNGTVENKSAEEVNWGEGKYNSSVRFNGSDSYIHISDDKLKDLGKQGSQYTICLWINSTASGSSDWLSAPVITEKVDDSFIFTRTLTQEEIKAVMGN